MAHHRFERSRHGLGKPRMLPTLRAGSARQTRSAHAYDYRSHAADEPTATDSPRRIESLRMEASSLPQHLAVESGHVLRLPQSYRVVRR